MQCRCLARFPGVWGARHTFTAMSFLGLFACLLLRVNLSVAIVAMVGRDDSGVNSSVTKGAPRSKSCHLSCLFLSFNQRLTAALAGSARLKGGAFQRTR